MRCKLILFMILISPVSASSQDLIVNGNFTDGNYGFLSDFTYSPSGLFEAKTYAIVDDPHKVHSQAVSYGDHTTGNGLMMVVNGSSTVGDIVWSQTINVMADQIYLFSIWTSSWLDPGRLSIRINGTAITPDINTPSTLGIWKQSIALWNSGGNVNATITIHCMLPHASGNDYALDDISFKGVSKLSLTLNKMQFGQLDPNCPVDIWKFSGIAGQQVRLEDVNMSEPGILFDLKGPNEWVGFEKIPDISPLVVLPESGEYNLNAYFNNIANSVNYSFILKETTVNSLGIPDKYDGEFAATGQAELFEIDKLLITYGLPLRITLDDEALDNINEIYVRFGIAPDRGNYDYSSTDPTPDQEILIPSAHANENCYILVYSALTTIPSNYTLSTEEQANIYLYSVSPSFHGYKSDAILTINGAGFDENTIIELGDSGSSSYPASSIDVYSDTELMATFTANSVPAGIYSVVATDTVSTDSDTLEDAFEMTEGVGAILDTDLVVPSNIGYHQVATIWIKYANTGDEAMPAPILILRAYQNTEEKAIMKLGDSVPPEGFWTFSMPEGFSSVVQFLAMGDTPGLLQPGEEEWVQVQYAGWLKPWDFKYPPITFELSVLNAENAIVPNWNDLKVEMQPDNIESDAWEALWTNFIAQLGGTDSTWGDYVWMLSQDAIYLAKMGQHVKDIGKLLSFEFAQADGMNLIKFISSATDGYVPAPGIDISFNRVYPLSISGRYMVGEMGRGWSHNWAYSLEVEGDGTVNIYCPGHTMRIFKPDIRPGYDYFSMSGDHATLTDLGGGVFQLQETSGLIRVFNPDGKLNYIEDTNGNRITASYSADKLDGLVHNLSPSLSLSLQYNVEGLIYKVIDPQGRETTFSYDPIYKHLESAEYFDKRTINYVYSNAEGNVKKHGLKEINYPGELSPSRTHQYFTYNDYGRLESSSKDYDAEYVEFVYDDTGIVTVKDAYANATEFRLDHRGLVIKAKDPHLKTTLMTYDNDYNLVNIVNPVGSSYLFEYDDNGNLVNSTNPLGYTTTFDYDFEGSFYRMTKLIDANGVETEYQYDSKGNLEYIYYNAAVSKTDYEQWYYNSDGTPQWWRNRRDQTITYDAYNAGRLTEKNFPNGDKVEYQYNSNNLPEYGKVTTSSETITTSFEYDSNDRLHIVHSPGSKSLTYTYNDAGQRKTSTNHKGHSLEYFYDDVGRLEIIKDETDNEIVHYNYLDDTYGIDAGRLEKKVLGNGVYTLYDYDNAGRLTSLVNYEPDDDVLSSFVYEYDALGRREAMTTHDGDWLYEYDDSGQLTYWKYTSSKLQKEVEYRYDPVGNRLEVIKDGGPPTSYVVNNLNQYDSVGTTDYDFDADGNLTDEDTVSDLTTYSYDDENRLIEVTSSSPVGHWLFTYDAFGNRIRVNDNGTETDYVVDPVGFGDVVGAYDHSTGNPTAYYDHGIGLLSYTDTSLVSPESYFYGFDAIGNTSEITDDIGNLVNNYLNEPFGNLMSMSGPVDNPYQYIGEYGVSVLKSNTHYMRARYYNNTIGRFSVLDPVGIVGGVNQYTYVHNSPIMAIDPCGLIEGRIWLGSKSWIQFNYEEPLIGLAIPSSPVQVWPNPNKGERVVGIGVSINPYQMFDLGSFKIGFGWKKTLEADLRARIGRLISTAASETMRLMKDIYLDINLGFYIFFYYLLTGVIPPLPDAEAAVKLEEHPTGPLDPNEKTGPSGYGPWRIVDPNSLLPYRVEFENDETATAPAQIVTIEDPLDERFDWTTFQLTGIGFGDIHISIPPNKQHFEKIVPFSFGGVEFEVHIDAGIHLATGEVYANFYSIDPNTGLPPAAGIGFLPPEDETGRGIGYFTYTIKLDEDIVPGALQGRRLKNNPKIQPWQMRMRIPNIAYITFDFQETIATNQIDPHDPSAGTDPEKEAYISILLNGAGYKQTIQK